MGEFLLLAFLFLMAGVIAVPIATRTGLGSVLGYLLAGIALSPLLDVLHVDVVSIQHFAEFGVVMMLFLVGLELEPKLLWEMRRKLVGLGGLQVGVTALLLMLAAMAFGLAWSVALAAGMILALSSTAIILQTLNEKGLLRGDGGQSAFSVLLLQDIAVIPMLALLPLLAVPELLDAVAQSADAESHGIGLDLASGLPGWLRGLVTVGAIAIVVVGGTMLTRPLFRFIATARLRELFTACALLIVIGIALLMTVVGLSPALGTFLAGVVLANSEYRHELESDIDPFKGLLLGLFFITVGAGIDFGLLARNLGPILGLTAGLILIKMAVLYGLARAFRIEGSDRWLFSLSLAQAGEFGFVLLALAVTEGVIPEELAASLLLIVALSMLLTPLLFVIYDRIIAPAFATAQAAEYDSIDHEAPVIIAGIGRFGGIVNRILRAAGYETVVLDHQSDHLERLRVFGLKVFFGDASRPDLLHAAGIARARMLVIAIDDVDQSIEMVRHVRENHPHVHIVARAVERHHVYRLWAAGCRDVIRDTFDSSIRAARSALEALGVHPYDAELMTRAYVESDKRMIRELADVYDPAIPVHENPAYVARARELLATHDAAVQGSSRIFGGRNERGWVPPTRDDVAAVKADASLQSSDDEAD